VQGLGTTFYTSLASDNLNGLDHMVVFKTVNPINDVLADGFQAFRYIVGFEDLPNLGDLDYNDYVVEILFSAVASVPEPGTLALFGAGLFGLSRLRRRSA
ncbi:MAG: PEP-CTERM sorting domain-containing protein, partial [Proteobacteria bacterium]|nr:PEP-CTERM sorting domain-containing protein [Pseudomonadota bacterium]